jgi:alkaline phosphatase D
MKHLTILSLFFLFTVSQAAVQTTNQTADLTAIQTTDQTSVQTTVPTVAPNIVVVLSMDGFRWDYKHIIGTPNLDRIAKEGVSAEKWQSSFPTVTFPNHYSMATGLYPNNHGIIHNTFYSNELGREYTMSKRDAVGDGRFYKGEPIWNTAQKQGKRTANFFWVGSEADIQGMRPDRWKVFDSKVPYKNRIDTVLKWLQLPAQERPDLIMFYFESPDNITHNNHPTNSEKTKAVVRQCDSLVGIFYDKIKTLPNAAQIHFIIVSDHGMCSVAIERSEYLSDYLKKEWIDYSNRGNPVAIMRIKEDKLDSALLMLGRAKHLKAWKNTDVPQRLHYGSNPDIGNLVILADSAYNIFSSRNNARSGAGKHGYDNLNSDMYGIFYGYGRDFKQNYKVDMLQNIQLYNIICRLLNITPAANDADINKIEMLFKK